MRLSDTCNEDTQTSYFADAASAVRRLPIGQGRHCFGRWRPEAAGPVMLKRHVPPGKARLYPGLDADQWYHGQPFMTSRRLLASR